MRLSQISYWLVVLQKIMFLKEKKKIFSLNTAHLNYTKFQQELKETKLYKRQKKVRAGMHDLTGKQNIFLFWKLNRWIKLQNKTQMQCNALLKLKELENP